MLTSFWLIILSSFLYCCNPKPVFGQYEDDPSIEDQNPSQEPQNVRPESLPESKENPSFQQDPHQRHNHQFHHSPPPQPPPPPPPSGSSSTQHHHQQQQQQQQQMVFKPINDYIQGKSTTILEQQFQHPVDSINDLFVKVEPEPVSQPEMHSSSSKDEKNYSHKPYGFGYDIDDGYGNKQWRHEKSSSPNQVTGSYGYKDKNGVMREVQYIADKYGFRAQIKTTEPGTASNDPAYVRMNANPLPVEYYPAKTESSSGEAMAAVAESTVNRKAKEMVQQQQQQYPGDLSVLQGHRPDHNRRQPEIQLQHQQQQQPPPAAALLDNDVGNFLSLFTPSNLNNNRIQPQHHHQQQQQQHYQTNRNPNGPRLMMRSSASSSSVVSSLPPLSSPFEPNDSNENDYHLAQGTSGNPNIIDLDSEDKANPY